MQALAICNIIWFVILYAFNVLDIKCKTKSIQNAKQKVFAYKTIIIKSVLFCPLQKKESCRHLLTTNQNKQNTNENLIYMVRLNSEWQFSFFLSFFTYSTFYGFCLIFSHNLEKPGIPSDYPTNHEALTNTSLTLLNY